MPDQKFEEIEHASLKEDSEENTESTDKPSEKTRPEDGISQSDNKLAIEDDLIKVESSPFDDFSVNEKTDLNDNDSELNTTQISDEIEPDDTTEPDFNDQDDATNPDFPTSTDKLYIMPEETVSNQDKEKLISSLQTKLPNIIKHRQQDQDESPDQIKPISRQSQTPDNLRSSEKSVYKPEAKTEIRPSIHPPKPEPGSTNLIPFRGRRLYMPPKMKIRSGDDILIRGLKFKAHKKDFDKKSLILSIFLGLVLITAVVLAGMKIFVPGNPGELVGIVLNSQTHAVLPDVQITINEKNETFRTDNNGLFRFTNLESGDWTVSANKPQYKSAALGFSLLDGHTSVITLAMEPTTPAPPDDNALKEKENKIKEVPITNYGKLTVSTNAPNAKIIVDNKMLGSSNKTYSNITTGKHKLVIIAEGYKEYSGSVNISRNKNNTFDIQMEELETEYKPSEISYEEYLGMADNMASNGDWREAAGNYTLALAKQEKPEIYRKRANAYIQLGQSGQAEADLFKAAGLYVRSGQSEKAIECLDNVLNLSPKNMKALRERGFANLRTSRFEQAVADLKNALEIDDNNFDNNIALGEAYYIMGQPKDALKYLKKARKINDSDARVYALCALASLSKGDEKDAKKYYKGFEIRAGADVRAEFERDPDWQKLSEMMSQADE